MKNKKLMIRALVSVLALLLMLSTVLVSASKNNKIATVKKETAATETETADKQTESTNIAAEEIGADKAAPEAAEEKISAADVRLSTVAAPEQAEYVATDKTSYSGLSLLQDVSKREDAKTFNIESVEKRFVYDTTKPATTRRSHNIDIYFADDGAKVEIDSVTGRFIGYSAADGVMSEDTGRRITAEEARSMAEDFINRYGSMQNLDFEGVKYNESLDGYYVDYVRYVAGYRTPEGIDVTIGANGKILSYLSNPHVFDGIDTDRITVDDEKVMEKINAAVEERFSGKDYAVTDLRLIAESGRLKMEYFVLVTDDIGTKAGYAFDISLD